MHMNRRPSAQRRFLVGACMALALPGGLACAAETVSVAQADGSVVVAPRHPEPVISLDLGAIDTLDALGIDVQGVPTLARWSGPLVRYGSDRYLKVGSLFAPHPEVIEAAAPQLILVGGRSAKSAASLARLARTLDMSVEPRALLQGVARNAAILGKLYSKEDEVARQLQALHAAIATLRPKARAAGTAMVLLVTGGKLVAQGPGTRLGFVHDVLGMPAAMTEPGTAVAGRGRSLGKLVTAEDIARIDPEWIFVIDRDQAIGRTDAAPAMQWLDREPVRRTRAWRHAHVVMLDGFDWYLTGNAGLGALRRTVQDLDRALSAQP